MHSGQLGMHRTAQLEVTPATIRAMFSNRLNPHLTAEIRERMLARIPNLSCHIDEPEARRP